MHSTKTPPNSSPGGPPNNRGFGGTIASANEAARVGGRQDLAVVVVSGDQAWLLPYVINRSFAPLLELDPTQSIVRGKAEVSVEKVKLSGQLPRDWRTDRLCSVAVVNPIRIYIESANAPVSILDCAASVSEAARGGLEGSDRVVGIAFENDQTWGISVWNPSLSLRESFGRVGDTRAIKWWIYIESKQ